MSHPEIRDIVDRLRDRHHVAFRILRNEAADEIERLRRENQRQAETLKVWMDQAIRRGTFIVQKHMDVCLHDADVTCSNCPRINRT